MSEEFNEGEKFAVIGGLFIGLLIGVCGCLIVGGIMGGWWEADSMEFKRIAVELNAAEWVVDPKTGKTTFTWKEPKP